MDSKPLSQGKHGLAVLIVFIGGMLTKNSANMGKSRKSGNEFGLSRACFQPRKAIISDVKSCPYFTRKLIFEFSAQEHS